MTDAQKATIRILKAEGRKLPEGYHINELGGITFPPSWIGAASRHPAFGAGTLAGFKG